MAFIFRDYTGPLMENFKRNTALFHLFDKGWSKENGFYFEKEIWSRDEGRWFREDVRWLRLLTALGISQDSLKDNEFEEIEYAYFYLNPNRISEELNDTDSPQALEDLTGVSREDIASAINSKLTVGDKVQVMTTYSGDTKKIIEAHEETWTIVGDGVNRVITTGNLNTDIIISTLLGDRWLYYANLVSESSDRDSLDYNTYDGSIMDYSDGSVVLGRTSGVQNPDSSPPCYTWLKTDIDSVIHEDSSMDYFSLAMLDDAESCFETTKEEGIPIVYNEIGSYTPEIPIQDDLEYFGTDGSLIIHTSTDISSVSSTISSYTFGFEYTFKGATADSKLVEDIYNHMYMLFSRDTTNNSASDTLQKKVLYNIYSIRDSSLFTWAEYFTDGKLSVEKAAGMKRYEFANLIADCLDSDVKVEDPSFLEKLVAIVAIVIAIVIVIWSVGTAAPGVATVLALAQGLGYASLVLTIGTMVLSQMGLSAQGLMKMIGNVAQITGIAAAVVGLLGSAMRMFATAAVNAGKTTATYTMQEFITDTATKFIDNITNAVTGSLRSVFDLLTDPMGVLMGTNAPGTALTPTGWLGRLSKGFEMYQKMFASSADTQTATTDEQLQRADFQYPEDMYNVQERTVYEPDALEKIHILKEEQLGGSKTEDLMQRIA